MDRINKYNLKIQEKIESIGYARTLRWAFIAGARKVKRKIVPPLTSAIIYEGNLSDDSIDAETMIAKDSHRVFIFSLIPYYDIGGGQRPAQLAKAFNKAGYSVYYFFGIHSSESKLFHIEIPTVMHRHIDGITAMDFTKLITEDDLVIFDFPYYKFTPFLDVAEEVGAKIIYENIDNWETSLGGEFFDLTALKNMLRKSNILVGTAKPLVRQLEGYLRKYKIDASSKTILYSANAVDADIFEPRVKHDKPTDLITGEKTLIYYGSLWGEWFDWDLIFGIAKEYPTYSIILIGDDKPVLDYVAKAPENIHFLGLKKQMDLPPYLEHSDIALIPFKVDKIGEYVSPLKIFEYIAMNKTILSTSLPDIIGYPNTYTGNTVASWNKALKDIKDKPVDEFASKEFTAHNTWFSRSADMLDAAYPDGAKSCDAGFYENISVIVLNYNNMNVIFDCVDSLLRYGDRYKYEIIVVDNQSKDGSYEELKKRYGKKIKLVRNAVNGCSSGRNLGVSKATKDYVLFLDSDQFALHRYWLDAFISLIKREKHIDVLGWAAGWLKKELDGYSKTVMDYPYNYMPANIAARKDVDYLGSGGMLLKKADFDQIRGFDERYDPTCFEDTDISLSMRHAGLGVYYSPYLGALHIAHQTTNSGSAEHQRLFDERQEYFFAKWSKINASLLNDTRRKG